MWERGGGGERADQRPLTRVQNLVWGQGRGPGRCPAQRAGSGLCPGRPPRGQSRLWGAPGLPFRARGFLQPAPPLPSASPGRPRPPLGPGLAAAAAAARQRSAASPRPESRPRRGECLRGAGPRGWGQPLSAAERCRAAGPRAVPSLAGRPRPAHSPGPRRSRALGPQAAGAATIQPRPKLVAEGAGAQWDLPSPGRSWRRLVGACDSPGPGLAGAWGQICHCVDYSGKLNEASGGWRGSRVFRALQRALQRKTP